MDKYISEINLSINTERFSRWYYEISFEKGYVKILERQTRNLEENKIYILEGILDSDYGNTLKHFTPCGNSNKLNKYLPIKFRNFVFEGAAEKQSGNYILYFNFTDSPEKEIKLNIKHLTLKKIEILINYFQFASNKSYLNKLKLEKIDTPLLWEDESYLAHILVNKIQYKIFEHHWSRPGRDDYFYLMKGIFLSVKSKYLENLIKEAINFSNIKSFEKDNSISSSLIPNNETEKIDEFVLKSDSGWTQYPTPNKEIYYGNYSIDLFICYFIRNFKRKNLLEEYLISK